MPLVNPEYCKFFSPLPASMMEGYENDVGFSIAEAWLILVPLIVFSLDLCSVVPLLP